MRPSYVHLFVVGRVAQYALDLVNVKTYRDFGRGGAWKSRYRSMGVSVKGERRSTLLSGSAILAQIFRFDAL